MIVLEKNSPGGRRAQVYEQSGFFFDMEPSWYLMPPALDHLSARLGETPQDHYDLIGLDPSCRIFHKEGYLDIRPDLDQNAETSNRLEERRFQKGLRYLSRAEKQYEISVENILYRYRCETRFFPSGFYPFLNPWKGSAFCLVHTPFQTAVFRTAHASKKARNLYFTGQHTHPGGGIPMILISAEVLADRIQRDHD